MGSWAMAKWQSNVALPYDCALVTFFNRNKWSWTYHAWREADPWDLEMSAKHSDMKRYAKLTDRGKVLKRAFAQARRG